MTDRSPRPINDSIIPQPLHLPLPPPQGRRRDHRLEARSRSKRGILVTARLVARPKADLVDPQVQDEPSAQPGRPSLSDDPPDQIRSLYAHFQHPWLHLPGSCDRRCGPQDPRCTIVRRRCRLRTTPRDRRQGPRRRLLRFLLVQGLRSSHRDAVRVYRGTEDHD